MFFDELEGEMLEKYGKEYFEICKARNIDPEEDGDALILIDNHHGGYYWDINPYYEWF